VQQSTGTLAAVKIKRHHGKQSRQPGHQKASISRVGDRIKTRFSLKIFQELLWLSEGLTHLQIHEKF